MDAPSPRAWCYYRNLVHTVYREARHVGSLDDPWARLVVEDPELQRSIGSIRKWRSELKGVKVFFSKVANASSPSRIRKPYEEMTDLSLEQLAELFDRPGWASGYGGHKWHVIVRKAIELGEALDRSDGTTAEALCDDVQKIEHNTGRLVPRTATEQNTEKWPVLCDAAQLSGDE